MTGLPCPECGSPLVLKEAKYGKFYGCSQFRVTGCRGSHSAHQDTGKPMGIPAKQEVKTARHNAHRVFDQLWMSGQMSRKRAYQWMQKVMGMTKREAHIGAFDAEQCARLISEIERLRKKVPSES